MRSNRCEEHVLSDGRDRKHQGSWTERSGVLHWVSKLHITLCLVVNHHRQCETDKCNTSSLCWVLTWPFVSPTEAITGKYDLMVNMHSTFFPPTFHECTAPKVRGVCNQANNKSSLMPLLTQTHCYSFISLLARCLDKSCVSL